MGICHTVTVSKIGILTIKHTNINGFGYYAKIQFNLM